MSGDIGDVLRIVGADLDARAQLAGVERPETPDAASAWAEVVSRQEAALVQRFDLFQRDLADPDAFIAEQSFSPLDVASYTTVAVENSAGALDVFTLISGADGVGAVVGDDNYLQIGDGEPGERNVADRVDLIDRPFSSLGIGWSGNGPSARATYVYVFVVVVVVADAAARPSADALFDPDNVIPTPIDGTEQVMGDFVAVASIETAGRTIVVTTALPDDPTEPVTVLFLPAFVHR